MAAMKLKVTGESTVDGHAPGDTFTVADDDPRVAMWIRAKAVTAVKTRAKKKKASK